MLDDYAGVLVTDFYGGYDAFKCRQQKCLVHLIRDPNDDLWKNPYNQELEGFVGSVKELLVPVMDDVYRFGLKRRFLRKHERSVNRFYKNAIDGHRCECEITERYQKRFVRYRESLFRFLMEDGIPWNNNMGERAIRHLAVRAKISGSFFKRVRLIICDCLPSTKPAAFRRSRFCGSSCRAKTMWTNSRTAGVSKPSERSHHERMTSFDPSHYAAGCHRTFLPRISVKLDRSVMWMH